MVGRKVIAGWWLALLAAACSRSALPIGGSASRSHSSEPCPAFRAEVLPAKLNVLLMMDSSGSMNDKTLSGATKWSAVSEAVEQFLFDPMSEGLGIGIAFFPHRNENVPEACVSDADCGEPGACQVLGVCFSGTVSGYCQTDAHCGDAGECGAKGVCVQGGGLCGGFVTCADPTDTCVEGPRCMNVTSCDTADYAIPAVGGLPDDALGVAAAIKTRSVEGATPSLAALSGVLASGVAYAATHPRDNTVAVFATDGLPTSCIPNYFETPLTEVVLDVAEAAAAGADAGIVTFVIGVFAPEEQDLAQTNLDTIAKAGGTDVAYVITTEESVTDRFLEALLAVRDAQRCDYAIPELDEPPSDWTKVSVSMTIDGSQVSGTRRDGPAQCTDQPGDFYYDVALGDDSAPAQITLCPATCDLAPDQLEASCR